MKERQIVESKKGVDRLHGMAVSYQLELVQCGKAKCRKWHGPYWYAYTRKDGRARSFYIGKQFRTLAELRKDTAPRRRNGVLITARGPKKGPPVSGKHASRTRGARRG